MIVKSDTYDVLEKYKMHAVAHNKLIQVQFDLTYQCNCSCFFCYEGNCHTNTREVLSTGELLDTLSRVKKMGGLFLAFSGGEPFLRSDLVEIIEFSKKLGYIIAMVTNMQVPNDEVLSRYIAAKAYRTTISFHALDPELYCSIFHVNRVMYNRALHNIDRLINEGLSIGIAATITNMNYQQMDLIKRYFMSKGLKSKDISFNLLVQGKNNILDSRTNEGMITYLRNHPNLEENILPISTGLGLCSAGRTSCTITPYGDVLPCTFFNSSAGNIKDSAIEEIWENSHLLRMIRSISPEHFNKCNSCDNKQYCRICIANNINETARYNLPSNQYCQFRQEITRSFKNK